MSYAPLDDRFDDHPKYADLGPAEMGIIACAITYCTRNRSDGRFPKVWPARRFGRDGIRLTKEMLRLRIWVERAEGDYEIVGFLDHNPSKSEIEARKAQKVEAGKRGGQASGGKRQATAQSSASPSAQAGAQAGAQASAEPTSLHFTALKKEITAASETRSPRTDAREPPKARRSDPPTPAASESFDSTPGESESGTRLVAPVVKAPRMLPPPEPLPAELEARRQAQIRELEARRDEFEPKPAGGQS